MDEKEITALARECAEEKTDAISFKAYADPDFKKELHTRGYANEAKEVIEWLLRRYCLVEKSKIGEAYFMAKNKYDNAESPTDMDLSLAQKEILDFIIPEIAKEVKG